MPPRIDIRDVQSRRTPTGRSGWKVQGLINVRVTPLDCQQSAEIGKANVRYCGHRSPTTRNVLTGDPSTEALMNSSYAFQDMHAVTRQRI
jgi:hypothetical protein